MEAIELTRSVGIASVDEALRRIIAAFERAFPGRIRGYYLVGSYADRSAVEISDIDLLVLFKGALAVEEDAAAKRLVQELSQETTIRLDVWASGETALERDAVRVKLGSVLVYGEDVRDRVALPPLRTYTREAMDGGRFFLTRVLRGMDQIVCPPDYPDPAGEFFGYDRVRIPEWYPTGTARGTKELVTATLRATTGLVALDGGRYVGGKGESVVAYREAIGDEWAGLLEALYTEAKGRWGYAVPQSEDSRARLRDLCRQMLGFERHFWRRERAHLLDLLRTGDEVERRFADERLSVVLFPGDAEVDVALAQFRQV